MTDNIRRGLHAQVLGPGLRNRSVRMEELEAMPPVQRGRRARAPLQLEAREVEQSVALPAKVRLRVRFGLEVGLGLGLGLGLAFLPLQAMQELARLSHVWPPPRLWATTWSTVVAGAPQ